jgi:hypothetical protein
LYELLDAALAKDVYLAGTILGFSRADGEEGLDGFIGEAAGRRMNKAAALAGALAKGIGSNDPHVFSLRT